MAFRFGGFAAVPLAVLPAYHGTAATLKTLFAFPNPTMAPYSPCAGLIKVGAFLYGTSQYGGTAGRGTVFRIDPVHGTTTLVHSFVGVDGANPRSALIEANQKLFGTAARGGAYGQGTVYEIDPSVSKERTIYSFGGPDGANPLGGLLAAGGKLYGTTSGGGANALGTIFQVVLSTGAETTLYSFAGTNSKVKDGAVPMGGLTDGGSGTLYGTTSQGGGAEDGGTIFGFVPATNTETVLYAFAGGNDGGAPQAAMVAGGGTLYGTTAGRPPNGGTVFSFNISLGTETVLHDFPLGGTTDGAQPIGPVALSLGVLYGTTQYGGANGYGTVFQVNAVSQAEVLLASFDGAAQSSPQAGVIVDGGILYGTTAGSLYYESGPNAGQPASLPGSVFSLDPVSGALDALASFAGVSPVYDASSGLTGAAGTLYGTTAAGGPSGDSAVFAVNAVTGAETTLADLKASGLTDAGLAGSPKTLFGTMKTGGGAGFGSVFSVAVKGGALKTVYAFTGGADGASPASALIEVGGTLYGTTQTGGTSFGGTVFSLNPGKKIETTLHAFGFGADGGMPSAGVIETGGVLYGTTRFGGNGAGSGGVVFALQRATGAETVLHAFTGGVAGNADGAYPVSGVILVGGELYGTAPSGGASFPGCGGSGCGVVYSVEPQSGVETVLYAFSGGADGGTPVGGLVAIGSTLYGAASTGGIYGAGTLFSVDRSTGVFTVIYSFMGLDDGALPAASLAGAGGVLYGTTNRGGAGDAGTVFSLTP